MNLILNGKQILKAIKFSLKNVQNLKNTVKGILWFCNKMPNKKPEDPTEVLTWKVSLPLMANKAMNQLITTSIDKGMIKNEEEHTINFVRDIIVGFVLVTHYHCLMVIENKSS